MEILPINMEDCSGFDIRWNAEKTDSGPNGSGRRRKALLQIYDILATQAGAEGTATAAVEAEAYHGSL